MDPTSTSPADLVLDAEIDRQVAPYRALLPADALEVFRSVLLEGLTEDAVLSAMMRQLRPVKPMLKSGDRPIDESSVDEAEKKPAAK